MIMFEIVVGLHSSFIWSSISMITKCTFNSLINCFITQIISRKRLFDKHCISKLFANYEKLYICHFCFKIDTLRDCFAILFGIPEWFVKQFIRLIMFNYSPPVMTCL